MYNAEMTFYPQAIINTLGAASFYVSLLLASQISGLLEPYLGIEGVFLIFAALSIVFLAIGVWFVPETGGSTYYQYVNASSKV